MCNNGAALDTELDLDTGTGIWAHRESENFKG